MLHRLEPEERNLHGWFRPDRGVHAVYQPGRLQRS